jgi:hypothetical protein
MTEAMASGGERRKSEVRRMNDEDRISKKAEGGGRKAEGRRKRAKIGYRISKMADGGLGEGNG